ncbi:MAG: hypothetical protein ACOVOW_14630 [Spirosomataceae bacterium]|jgi:hypothetical protein
MKYLSMLLLCAISIFSISSCKKSDASPKSKTEYLTAVEWYIQSANSVGGLVVVYDRSSSGNLYDLSKVRLQFQADGKVKGIDNNGNSSNSGTWKFSNNETQIEISNFNFAGLSLGIANIDLLDATHFNFSGSADLSSRGYGIVQAQIKLVPSM